MFGLHWKIIDNADEQTYDNAEGEAHHFHNHQGVLQLIRCELSSCDDFKTSQELQRPNRKSENKPKTYDVVTSVFM